MSYTLMIGLGAQKSATSWLHAYLRAHPQCAFSMVKEMHFWSETFIPGSDLLARRYTGRWISRIGQRMAEGDAFRPGMEQVLRDLTDRAAMRGDPAAYRRFFDARIGEARVTGEISPSYSALSRDQMREMRACHPDIRTIFIMRDPVDRFWSAISEMVHKEGRVADLAHVCDILSRNAHRQRGAYDRIIPDMEDAFGAENALPVYYEDLFSETTITRICAFLGIDPVPAPFERRVNAQPSTRPAPSPEIAQAIYETHREVYDWAANRPNPLPQKWQARMATFGS